MTDLLYRRRKEHELHKFDVVRNDGVIKVSVWPQPIHVTWTDWKCFALILFFIMNNKLSSQ